MNEKVLVTYASKYGATKEIAEKIGAELEQAGVQVELLPADRNVDPTPYKAVIIGAALYVGKWHKAAEAFVKSQEQSLTGKPVWIFSSGPSGEGNPLELVEGKVLPANMEAIVKRIQPRDVTVFHGDINLDKINAIEKWAVKSVVKKPFGDYRDWKMISAWASKVAGELQSA